MAKCSICGKDFVCDCWLLKDEPKIEIIYRCPDCGADYKDKLIIEKNNKIKELEYYKEAYRELCHYVEYDYPKQNDDIWYRKEQELEMIFLNKVKERSNDSEEDTEMD